MQRTALLLSVACFFSAYSTVTAASSECTQGGMVRNIKVVYLTPGEAVPCEVLYEKPSEGERMTLWRAQNEDGYCEARAAEFAAKLESLGWQCAAEAVAGDDPA